MVCGTITEEDPIRAQNDWNLKPFQCAWRQMGIDFFTQAQARTCTNFKSWTIHVDAATTEAIFLRLPISCLHNKQNYLQKNSIDKETHGSKL